jgi:hypothetical protein
MEKVKVLVPEFFIRSRTVRGESSKQTFVVVRTEDNDAALLIRKLVLSGDINRFADYKILKQFKNQYLFELVFSIKIKTLEKVVSHINEYK